MDCGQRAAAAAEVGQSREWAERKVMGQIKPLVIGDLVVEKPVIQGGMGVGISLHRLAGAVAKAGGLGIISTAQIGFREPDFKENPLKANLRAIGTELKKAREIAPRGAVGFNIMVATKEYGQYVKTAVKAGADIIISGAGLPVSLPEYAAEAEEEMKSEQSQDGETLAGECGQLNGESGKRPGKRTKLAPIVSTAKSAAVICRYWDRRYKRVPDLVVIEGPLAGGHLGFSREQLAEYGADTEDVEHTYRRGAYDQEVREILKVVRGYEEKYGTSIPVVTAGGIYDHEDMMHQLDLGADGVQVATRFVTTRECDAPECYKQAYIDAGAKDIVITKSPVGMPGRAIVNPFLKEAAGGRIPPKRCFQCLEKCDPASTPYCITAALVNAAEGDLDHALLFCGSNACKAQRIETVDEVMRELMGE